MTVKIKVEAMVAAGADNSTGGETVRLPTMLVLIDIQQEHTVGLTTGAATIWRSASTRCMSTMILLRVIQNRGGVKIFVPANDGGRRD